MSEFPKMIYQKGGDLKVGDNYFKYKIVDSKEDQDRFVGNGWYERAEDSNIVVIEDEPKKKRGRRKKSDI